MGNKKNRNCSKGFKDQDMFGHPVTLNFNT